MSTLKPRINTSIYWATVNPILNENETGIESDTGMTKVGNGIDNWNELNYIQSKKIAVINEAVVRIQANISNWIRLGNFESTVNFSQDTLKAENERNLLGSIMISHNVFFRAPFKCKITKMSLNNWAGSGNIMKFSMWKRDEITLANPTECGYFELTTQVNDSEFLDNQLDVEINEGDEVHMYINRETDTPGVKYTRGLTIILNEI